MDAFKQLDTDASSDQFPSLLNKLQQHGKTVFDVLLLESSNNLIQLSKSLGRPLKEIEAYAKALKTDLQLEPASYQTKSFISTGLPSLDQQMGGGIPRGEITEIFGEAGCGKSQLLLQLAVQCQKPNGECVYISTESFLETKRLERFITTGTLMDNVSYIFCPDIESQDHILFTQLPLKLQASPSVKLVILDSIAQHLRREDGISNITYLKEELNLQQEKLHRNDDYQLATKYETFKLPKLSQAFRNKTSKSHYMALTHKHLTRLAQVHNVAVVLINQVSDVVEKDTDSFTDLLDLDFQVGISSGWDLPTWRKSDELRKSKRRRINTSLGASVSEIESRNQTTLSQVSQYDFSSTKKQVPTLGYSWSKRIQNRILLMKFYGPPIDFPSTQSIEIENGWQVERFSRVVASSCKVSAELLEKVEFKITNDGLLEI